MENTHIITSHQQANAIWTTIVSLSAQLHLQSQQFDQSSHWIVGIVHILVIHAFLSHITAQIASIRCNSSHTQSHVIVDWQDFLLVSRQLGSGSL